MSECWGEEKTDFRLFCLYVVSFIHPCCSLSLSTHRDQANTIKCKQWRSTYKVVPGASWGELPANLQEEWKTINCDEFLVERKETIPSADCTNINANSKFMFCGVLVGGERRGGEGELSKYIITSWIERRS